MTINIKADNSFNQKAQKITFKYECGADDTFYSAETQGKRKLCECLSDFLFSTNLNLSTLYGGYKIR